MQYAAHLTASIRLLQRVIMHPQQHWLGVIITPVCRLQEPLRFFRGGTQKKPRYYLDKSWEQTQADFEDHTT